MSKGDYFMYSEQQKNEAIIQALYEFKEHLRRQAMGNSRTPLLCHIDCDDINNIFEIHKKKYEETEVNEGQRNLRVCSRCLAGIESKEGPQIAIEHTVEAPDDICDWCEIDGVNVLYELI